MTQFTRQAAEQRDVNAHFGKIASYWAKIYESRGVTEFVHQERLRLVLKLVDELSLPPRSCILDVGCGAGFATVALAQKGLVVHAIDPVPQMIEATRNRATRAGVAQKVQTAFADAYSLPFRDESFSVVVAMGVLPWLSSPKTSLREMSRVLRSGGHLLVSIDNRWALCRFLDPRANPLLKPVRDLMRSIRRHRSSGDSALPWSPRSIRECRLLLSDAGLQESRNLTLGFGPFSFCYREFLPYVLGLKLHQVLQRLAQRNVPILRSSGSQFILLAKKPAKATHKCAYQQHLLQEQGVARAQEDRRLSAGIN